MGKQNLPINSMMMIIIITFAEQIQSILFAQIKNALRNNIFSARQQLMSMFILI